MEKIELSTGYVLQTWDSILKAAQAEKLTTAKMSRSIKDATVFIDYFYRIKSD